MIDDAKLIFVTLNILDCSRAKAVMGALPCRYRRDQATFRMVSLGV